MYFNCHAHTDYSNVRLLDCINSTRGLIEKSIELGLTGVAITDHEILGSHVEVNRIAKEIKSNKKTKGFKIAYGNEIYLTDTREPGGKYFHFILLAKDYNGYLALRELSSGSWYSSYVDRGMTRVPTLKSELKAVLEKYKGSLIGTTACLGGELPFLVSKLIQYESVGQHALAQETKAEIGAFIEFQKEIFGEDFYIEVAPAIVEDQVRFNSRVRAIAKFFNVKITVGTDAHYLRPEDREIHKAYLNSKEGEREVDAFYSAAYVMTANEVTQALSECFPMNEIREILDNTNEIRDKIKDIDLQKPQRIPKIEIRPFRTRRLTENYPNLNRMIASHNRQDAYWVNTCLKALEDKDLFNEEYLERLESEADVIMYMSDRLGDSLSAYFNTLQSYIDLFWECGSIVGPGRGSAVGFLSNYLLNITQIDPIKYDLPAFRFLNKERVELPDIDIDLAPSKRQLIFDKIRERIGETNLLQVCTYGKEGTRSAILTACRGYRSAEFPQGVDIDDAHYMTSLIPVHRGFLWPIKDVVFGNSEEDRRPVTEFINEVNKFPGLLNIIQRIEGIICARSIHAAGVVFYDGNSFNHTGIMRSPNGDLTTQFSLEDEEYLGGLKYDFLLTEVSDKIMACLDFLQKDGLIDSKLTLREQYDKYLHPEKLDLEDPKLWNAIGKAEVLDAFQFSTGAGRMTAMQVKPQNIHELTASNALMRLMGEKDKEKPVDRYTRLKKNPNLWKQEALEYGLTGVEIDALTPYYDKHFGTPPFQEDIMLTLMDSKISGFTLKESNDTRKIIGKKQMERIPELKQHIFEQTSSIRLADYIWETLVLPQLGYGFSSLHSLAYSFVTVQTVYLATSYPKIYWSAACLAVNSGSANAEAEGKSTDYSKIAKALGQIVNNGINVSLLNINTSDFGFKPVVETDSIRFGLRGVNKVGTDLVNAIIANRPYTSMLDFMKKVNPNRQAMVSLVKGGAFDEIEQKSRQEVMMQYLWLSADKKKRITLQNMKMMIELKLIPDKLSFEEKVYSFNQYLKELCLKENHYFLDERAYNFYKEYFDEDELEYLTNEPAIRVRDWTRIYNQTMDAVRTWMKAEQETLLTQLNKSIVALEWQKYADGTISSWEMDSLCFYHSEHELESVNLKKYGISRFRDLSPTPKVDYVFKRGGKEFPIYELSKIVGTCVGKDKNRSTVSILTTDGVLDIRLNASMYAAFDKQLSVKLPSGKKKITDTSWFNRGNKIMVAGYRRGDDFIPKTYSRTPFHTLYKIESIDSNGDLLLTSSRGGE